MISNFKEEKLFPIVKFPQCDGGKLHDEFFDTPELYKKLGVYRRKPIKGDNTNERVIKRIGITKLEKPHPHREPQGVYKPTNLRHPVEKNYVIEYNK